MDDICSPWRHPNAKTENVGPAPRERIPFTDQLFREMLAAQGGRCAMEHCRVLFSGTGYCTPQRDHDHVTGEPRGLLCRDCNTQLGRYERASAQRAAFAKYLSQK